MKYAKITSTLELKELINDYNHSASYLVMDTETTGLDPFTDTLLAITVTAGGSDKAYFVPGEMVLEFQALKCPLVLHNFKFDYKFMLKSGVDLRQCDLLADTLHLDHLLDENNNHGLDDIIQRRYKDDYKTKFWDQHKEYTDAPEEAQIEYACKDVLYTDHVYIDTIRDLSTSGIPKSLLEHVRRLALALYDTEVRGLKLDLPYLSQIGENLGGKISQLRENIRGLVELECQIIEGEMYATELDKRKTIKGKLGVARPSFNLDSTAQLPKLLYEQLGLPVQLNKQRNKTCDDAALEALESKHPVVALIREYRGYQKVFTSFIEGSLEKAHQGRVYPSFNVSGTVTGRLSSSQPNLQQLPAQGGVRGIYVPEEGYRFISADYKQLEVVIAAHFSRDPALLSIIFEGASQHDITAAALGIPRATAKRVNFALMYGAGPSKLREILGYNPDDAEAAYKRYWDAYPGLREYNRRCHEQIERGEPLRNPFGRCRRFPAKFENHWEKERAKRQGPNALIQSTGSDCTSRAVYLVNDKLRKLNYGHVLFSVHDEILINVKKEFVDAAKDILQTVMVGVGEELKLTVPLAVDVSEGMERWLD